uniref:Uncharacterized protein n=1 Tax=Escherichia coli TaxID=562 RepID=A0A1W5T7X9_ECOLX|nr:hypothetical protein [Escherichia coli]
MTLPSTWPRTLWSLVKRGSRSSSSRMKRPVAGCGRGSPPHRGAPCVRAVTYALFALDSGNEEYLAAAKAQLAAAE